MCSCLAPRAGLNGLIWLCRWAEASVDLHWAVGRVVCCKVFHHITSSRRGGETGTLVRRVFPGPCRAKVDMWASEGFVALFVVEKIET